MKAIVINPNKYKAKKSSKTLLNKERSNITMAKGKKKKGGKKKKYNPSLGWNNPNPKKSYYHRKKKNPMEGLVEIFIGGLLAAGGSVINEIASSLVIKVVGRTDGKMQNLIKLLVAGGGALLLPKIMPRQYAMPIIYGAFAGAGAGIITEALPGLKPSTKGIGASVDVQAIIDDIDSPSPISGRIGYVEEGVSGSDIELGADIDFDDED